MEICSALLHLSPRPPFLRETLATLKSAPPQIPRPHLRLPSALVPQRANRHARIWIQSTPQIRPSFAPLRVSKGDADIVVGDMGGRIAVGSAITILFAVANRVLYKLALVPMKEYPFFLAQFTTFGGAGEGQFLSHIELIWPALMVASSALQAGASILKEFVFIDGSKRLQGKPLDIFVVNSFGSAFQALFVFLLLPFLSNMRGIPFAELPAYLKGGAACFLNVGKGVTGCEGAPFLPLLFVTINMAFNISLLNLVKMSSALVSSLASTLSVPVSIYILSLPLPYIPEAVNLSTNFVIGTAILVFGLLLYNLPKPASQFPKND